MSIIRGVDMCNNTGDDVSIQDDDNLWRRITPEWIVEDKNAGELRPSSAAFQDHPNGSAMSVGIASVAAENDRTPTDMLVGHQDYGLVGFPVHAARLAGQAIRRSPLENQPEHGEVVGKKTRSVRRQLARASVWVVPPI